MVNALKNQLLVLFDSEDSGVLWTATGTDYEQRLHPSQLFGMLLQDYAPGTVWVLKDGTVGVTPFISGTRQRKGCIEVQIVTDYGDLPKWYSRSDLLMYVSKYVWGTLGRLNGTDPPGYDGRFSTATAGSRESEVRLTLPAARNGPVTELSVSYAGGPPSLYPIIDALALAGAPLISLWNATEPGGLASLGGEVGSVCFAPDSFGAAVARCLAMVDGDCMFADVVALPSTTVATFLVAANAIDEGPPYWFAHDVNATAGHAADFFHQIFEYMEKERITDDFLARLQQRAEKSLDFTPALRKAAMPGAIHGWIFANELAATIALYHPKVNKNDKHVKRNILQDRKHWGDDGTRCP